jgi:flagellar hook-basal body complex protein FliE
MDTALKLLSLWSIVDSIVRTSHDLGFQGVLKQALAVVDQKVQAGQLPSSFATGIAEVLADVLLHHPAITNPIDAAPKAAKKEKRTR